MTKQKKYITKTIGQIKQLFGVILKELTIREIQRGEYANAEELLGIAKEIESNLTSIEFYLKEND